MTIKYEPEGITPIVGSSYDEAVRTLAAEAERLRQQLAWHKERYRDLMERYDSLLDSAVAAEARAEAAEAARADCQQCYANARDMVEEYMSSLHELCALRQVAEASCNVRVQFEGVEDWSWATKGISFAMVDLWDALVALDAARGQGGDGR